MGSGCVRGSGGRQAGRIETEKKQYELPYAKRRMVYLIRFIADLPLRLGD